MSSFNKNRFRHKLYTFKNMTSLIFLLDVIDSSSLIIEVFN